MTDSNTEEKVMNFASDEFFERLGGPEGLNPRTVDGRERWDCFNKSDYPHARKILADMGVAESQTKEFTEHFKKHVGTVTVRSCSTSCSRICAGGVMRTWAWMRSKT
jgi:hypothetical protein